MLITDTAEGYSNRHKLLTKAVVICLIANTNDNGKTWTGANCHGFVTCSFVMLIQVVRRWQCQCGHLSVF